MRGLCLFRLLTLLKGWSPSPVPIIQETRELGAATNAGCVRRSLALRTYNTERNLQRHPEFDPHPNLTPPSPPVYILFRHEAAYKLTGNAEAVAKFACRGSGKGSGWNLLPGRAPLSDPNAVPNTEILPDVDYCLRRVRLCV